MKKIYLFVATVFLILLGAFIFYKESVQSSLQINSVKQDTTRKKRSLSAAEKSRSDHRLASLSLLTKKWLAYRDSNEHDANKKRENMIALVKESIDELLCSNELFSLIAFLEKNQMMSESNQIKFDLHKVFITDKAAEARMLLLDLPSDIARNYFYDSCKMCNEAELNDYMKLLDKGSPQKDALFGYCVTSAKRNPDQAMELFMKEYSLGESYMSQPAMRDFLKALPDNIDYAKLDQMTPADTPVVVHGNPYNEFRRKLYEKWVSVDPASAINYVVVNSDHINPEYITAMMEEYTRKNRTLASEWIKSFPAGLTYDYAVIGLAQGGYNLEPEKFEALIPKMQDPELIEDAKEQLRMGIGTINSFRAKEDE